MGHRYHSGLGTISPPVGSKIKIIKRTYDVPNNPNRYDGEVGSVLDPKDVKGSSLREKGTHAFCVGFPQFLTPNKPIIWHREHIYELVSLPEGYVGTYEVTVTTQTQEGSQMEYISTAVRMKDGWIAQVKAVGSGIDKIVWEGTDHYVDLTKDGEVVKQGNVLAIEAARAQIEEVIEDIFNA